MAKLTFLRKTLGYLINTNVTQFFVGGARGFISSFEYIVDEETIGDHESDFSEAESNPFECPDVTEGIEEFVTDNVDQCAPLEKVYGGTVSDLVKTTIETATEDTQCTGIKAIGAILDSNDEEKKSLIRTCTEVCYWCCCETIKHASPVIANATINLLAD